MTKNTVILLNLLPSRESSYDDRGSFYPHTGIMLVGTLLKEKGYEVKIIDGAYYENYLEILESSIRTDDVLYVGIGVMTPQISMALEASKLIKESNADIPVVWGGPHPTMFSEQTARDENVDVVIVNEGAFTALELAKCYKSGEDLKNVKGICFRDENSNLVVTPPSELEDINELPFFDFSLLDVENYLDPDKISVYAREFPESNSKIRLMPILTGLGCPFKCQFCINVILGRKYRSRSAESIVSEIKRLQEKYGVNTFLFLDENFFANKKRVMEFVSLVEQEDLHFNWRFWCRVDYFKENYINDEFLKRLQNIGEGSMVMGAESANIEQLNMLKKGITPEQIMNSLYMLSKTKIFPRYSFIVGLENETLQQIKNTYAMCLEMTRINPKVDIAGPFIFRLFPGSPIYERIVKKYNLKRPTSLDGWVEYLKNEDIFNEMVWAPEWFQENSRILTFYANQAFRSYEDKIYGLKGVLYPIIRVFSRLRLKYFFFKFPFEYRIYRTYSLHLKKNLGK